MIHIIARRAALWLAVTALMVGGSACSSTPSRADSPSSTRNPDPAAATTAPPGNVVPGAKWARTTPENAGLEPDALASLLKAGEAAASSCVLVVREDKIVAEGNWPGPDPRSEEVFSVTKSLTSILVGVAEYQGLLSVEDRVSDYVPEWVGTASEDVTIEQILAGVSGRHWDMATDYGAMAVRARDKTAFAIGLSQQHDPGTTWAYNNAAVQVLSRVIEAATGTDAAEFAEREVFAPLGMASSDLRRDPTGGALTFMGLSSTCQDVARLGLLMVHDGRWGSRRLLSADYVERATAPATELNAAYGWLWWVNGEGPIVGPTLATTGHPPGGAGLEGPLVPAAPTDAFWALGLNDQVLAVLPDEGIIAVRLGGKPPRGRPFGVQELTTGVVEAIRAGLNSMPCGGRRGVQVRPDRHREPTVRLGAQRRGAVQRLHRLSDASRPHAAPERAPR